jgi:hypothetical protein
MSKREMNEPSDDLQQWIDGLLTSPEAKPEVPQALRAEIQRAIGRRRRVKMARRLVAAAAVFAALVFWPRGDRGTEDPQLAVTPPPALQEHLVEPVARFIADDDTIAVEIESPSPNVTILQVYPTLSAQRHREREALLQQVTRSVSYNGG